MSLAKRARERSIDNKAWKRYEVRGNRLVVVDLLPGLSVGPDGKLLFRPLSNKSDSKPSGK